MRKNCVEERNFDATGKIKMCHLCFFFTELEMNAMLKRYQPELSLLQPLSTQGALEDPD